MHLVALLACIAMPCWHWKDLQFSSLGAISLTPGVCEKQSVLHVIQDRVKES